MEYSFLPSAKYPRFIDTGKAVNLPIFVNLTHIPNTLH